MSIQIPYIFPLQFFPYVILFLLSGSSIIFLSKLKRVGHICKYIGQISISIFCYVFCGLTPVAVFIPSMSICLLCIFGPFKPALRKKIIVIMGILFIIVEYIFSYEYGSLVTKYYITEIGIGPSTETLINDSGIQGFSYTKNSMFFEVKGVKNYANKFSVSGRENYPLPYIIGEVFTIKMKNEHVKFDEGKLTITINDSFLAENPIEKLWIGCVHNDNNYVEHLDTTVESDNSLSIGLNSDKLLECSMFFVVNQQLYEKYVPSSLH